MRPLEIPNVRDGRRQKVVDVFQGLNRLPDPQLGQWADELNLSTARYPRMSVRPASGRVQKLDGNPGTDVLAIGGGDELAVVFRIEDSKGVIYARGNKLTVYERVQDIPAYNRQIVRMGAYAVMWPDGYYVNAVKLAGLPSTSTPDTALSSGTDYGWIDAEYRAEEPTLGTAPTITLALVDDTGHEYYDIDAAPPLEPTNGDAYISLKSGQPKLLQYFNGEWEELPTYTRIYADGIYFEIGDWVTMSANISETSLHGTDSEETVDALLNDQHEIHSWGSGLHGDFIEVEGAFYLACPGDLAVLTFALENTLSTSAKEYIEVTRKAPKMDLIVECQNRLWGCFYGVEDGKQLNELYCCALGDFKQWRKYNQLSTASWTASRGRDGPWTGAAVLDGTVLFFKSGCVDKVFPSATGAHQVLTQDLDGVEAGAWRTVAVIDDAVYYKAQQGVMRYTGTLPTLISEELGTRHYKALIAAQHEELYCIAMQRTAQEAYRWYSYDTRLGVWHCGSDDSDGAGGAVTFQRKMYFLGDSPSIWAFDAGSGAGKAPDGVRWYAETGEIGWRDPFASRTAFDTPARKYVSRVFVRIQLALGAAARLLIAYDGGQWQLIDETAGVKMTPRLMMIRPKRCDSFRLRIDGIGAAEVQSVSMEIATGSRWH